MDVRVLNYPSPSPFSAESMHLPTGVPSPSTREAELIVFGNAVRNQGAASEPAMMDVKDIKNFLYTLMGHRVQLMSDSSLGEAVNTVA